MIIINICHIMTIRVWHMMLPYDYKGEPACAWMWTLAQTCQRNCHFGCSGMNPNKKPKTKLTTHEHIIPLLRSQMRVVVLASRPTTNQHKPVFDPHVCTNICNYVCVRLRVLYSSLPLPLSNSSTLSTDIRASFSG